VTKRPGFASDPRKHPTHNPNKIPGQRYPYARGEVIMGKAIECIHENNILKPVGKVPFHKGERMWVMDEKKTRSNPYSKKRNQITNMVFIN
jgi:predicted DNA-binding antitoxin AbrB/MazE fold protein